MKKLASLFAAFSLTLALGAAGCNKDDAAKDDNAMKPADKPADKKPADKPADSKPAASAPASSAASSAAAPAAAGGDLPAGLPQECKDYVAAMAKISSCDKLPKESKDAMAQGVEAMKSGWKDFDKMPAEAQKQAADACKQGTDALNQTGKSVCGW
jgi:hypothetical protein